MLGRSVVSSRPSFRDIDVIPVNYQFFSGHCRNPWRPVGVRVPVKHSATVKTPHLIHVSEPEVGAFRLLLSHSGNVTAGMAFFRSKVSGFV